MPRNGNGIYTAPVNSWNPAINGVAATAADWQAQIDDLAAAMTQSLSADGQTPVTGNLNMGNAKLTNLAAGVNAGDSLRWQQLFSQGTPQDVASAATTDIGALLTTNLRITGSTTITSFGTNYNGPRFIRFGAALTLTHNATTLILPTGANITTAAGDSMVVAPKAAVSGTADGWQVIAYQRANGSALTASADLLNSTRIDVASAATVNLTADAPNTRHINITGTTNINAFTVSIGQCYFVRFAGALTIANNANIVTNLGAAINTQAGDTCILRATAANVVELLAFSGAAASALAQAGTDGSHYITPSTLVDAKIIQAPTQTTTSGTTKDFTGIPPWAKRVTILFNNLSTDGSGPIIQIGDGTIQTSGYSGNVGQTSATAAASTGMSNGFLLSASFVAASTISGKLTLDKMEGSNTWIATGITTGNNAVFVNMIGGIRSLTGALSQVRLNTVSGGGIFDSGSIGCAWE